MAKKKWDEEWDAGGAFSEYDWSEETLKVALAIHQMAQYSPVEFTAEDVAEMIKCVQEGVK